MGSVLSVSFFANLECKQCVNIGNGWIFLQNCAYAYFQVSTLCWLRQAWGGHVGKNAFHPKLFLRSSNQNHSANVKQFPYIERFICFWYSQTWITSWLLHNLVRYDYNYNPQHIIAFYNRNSATVVSLSSWKFKWTHSNCILLVKNFFDVIILFLSAH